MLGYLKVSTLWIENSYRAWMTTMTGLMREAGKFQVGEASLYVCEDQLREVIVEVTP